MKILITGASGFIGSFIVQHALSEGMEVWAGIRSTSSLRYLNDDHIHFIELDFDNPEKLKNNFSVTFPSMGNGTILYTLQEQQNVFIVKNSSRQIPWGQRTL